MYAIRDKVYAFNKAPKYSYLWAQTHWKTSKVLYINLFKYKALPYSNLSKECLKLLGSILHKFQLLRNPKP